MAVILLLLVAALAGNALALNEYPTEELANNEIYEEILPGNVVFDNRSLYTIDNSTEASMTAVEDIPKEVSAPDVDDDKSRAETEALATPIADSADNSITPESNETEAEKYDPVVEFTDILTTKLKQIANDFEIIVSNDKGVVDIGKIAPQAEEKIEDNLLSEINTVMGLIPKEIMEVITKEVENPMDIEVTITFDDTPSVAKDEISRKVTATNATVFAESNNGTPQGNTAPCQKAFGPVCYLQRNNVPNAQPVQNCNMVNVPLMQARCQPRYYAIPQTTPRVAPFQQYYVTSASLTPTAATYTDSQTMQPNLPQGVRRSRTSTERHNVFTGDAVVTDETREESEVMQGSTSVHRIHSDLVERLFPAQDRHPVTPIQQYYVPRLVNQ